MTIIMPAFQYIHLGRLGLSAGSSNPCFLHYTALKMQYLAPEQAKARTSLIFVDCFLSASVYLILFL